MTDFKTQMKYHLKELFYSGPLTEMANELGKTASYLSQMANDYKDMPIDVALLVRAMNYKKNYKALKAINLACGYIPPVKLPRVAATKADKDGLIEDYRTISTEAVSAFVKYCNNPSKSSYEKVIKALDEIIKTSVQNKKYVEKDYSDQYEMELE